MVTVGLLMIATTTVFFSTGACEAIDGGAKIRQVRSPFPRRMYLPAPPGQTPDCAKNGQTFCENISDYPGDLIYKLLKSSKLNYKKFLVSETEDDVPPQIKLPSIKNGVPKYENIDELLQLVADSHTLDGMHELEYFLLDDIEAYGKLMNSQTEEYGYPYPRTKRQIYVENENHEIVEDFNSPCRPENAMIMPKVAMNTAKEWRYIVNMPELGDHIQMVKMKNCHPLVHNKPCPKPCTNRPYETKCTTVFLESNLMALDPFGEEIIFETFMMPVGCECKEDMIGEN